MMQVLALSGSVVLGSTAQILLKRGTSQVSARLGWRAYLSPWILGWAACFCIATLLWLVALAHMDISYAYPLLGIGYVIVVILAACFLGERISGLRWLAIAVISAGVAMIAGSR